MLRKQYNFTPIRRINMSDGFKFTEEWHRNLKDPVVIVLPPGKNQEVLDFYQGQFGDKEIEVMDWSKFQPDHRSVFAHRNPRLVPGSYRYQREHQQPHNDQRYLSVIRSWCLLR